MTDYLINQHSLSVLAPSCGDMILVRRECLAAHTTPPQLLYLTRILGIFSTAQAQTYFNEKFAPSPAILGAIVSSVNSSS